MAQTASTITPMEQVTPARRPPTVRTPAGTVIPGAEARARRIAEEAERWLDLARETTRMCPSTLRAKAFGSCAFSVHHATASLAVPSKLVGTSRHQGVLERLAVEVDRATADGCEPWVRLAVRVTEDGVEVSYEGSTLGTVQTKHTAWVRALVPFGLGVDATRVTGRNGGFRLGCNVAFVVAGEALRRRAGDRPDASERAVVAGAPVAAPGAPPTLRLVAADRAGTGVTVHPEHAALSGDPDDVVLWRTAEGSACASVPHVARHSPSGIEWGYHGSGPSDLARSVLLALVDEPSAEALYRDFKREVVAVVPREGGVLRAADVRAWSDRATGRQRAS